MLTCRNEPLEEIFAETSKPPLAGVTEQLTSASVPSETSVVSPEAPTSPTATVWLAMLQDAPVSVNWTLKAPAAIGSGDHCSRPIGR
jgi:hypothetical protein